MENDYGRIHRLAFKASVSVLFAAAIIANIGRVLIRLRYQNRLFADDYFLLFGCSALIAAFTLTNVMFEDIYFDMGLILGPIELVVKESTSVDFKNRILHYQQLSFSAEVLCWVTIFAVKMSYLLFFRHLVDRTKAHLTYWTVTVCIVVVSGLFCICSIFISCPHFGVSAIECAQGQGFTRTIAISQLANALNMLTDLLIVAVPVGLLWNVNIRLHQKIILGTFLCLSVCMFAICLVRTTGETIHGNIGSTVDVQWNVFWQLIEASVAVIVVSLTAFRSLYGIKTLQQERKNKKRYEPWLSSYRKNILNRRKQRRVDEFGDTISDESHQLPSIPGATLTGIRTMISGKKAMVTKMLSGRGDLVSIDETQKEKEGEEDESSLVKVVSDPDAHKPVQGFV